MNLEREAANFDRCADRYLAGLTTKPLRLRVPADLPRGLAADLAEAYRELREAAEARPPVDDLFRALRAYDAPDEMLAGFTRHAVAVEKWNSLVGRVRVWVSQHRVRVRAAAAPVTPFRLRTLGQPCGRPRGRRSRRTRTVARSRSSGPAEPGPGGPHRLRGRCR